MGVETSVITRELSLQEALAKQQSPDTVLQEIWRLVGQVLLDTPGNPVQLSKAVHVLIGTQPPADVPGSPVSQVSQRQARTDQALNDIGIAAAQQESQPPVAFDSVAEAQTI